MVLNRHDIDSTRTPNPLIRRISVRLSRSQILPSLFVKTAMTRSPGGTSKLAGLSEALRNLEVQTLQLEPQLRVPVGDFDTDVRVTGIYIAFSADLNAL